MTIQKVTNEFEKEFGILKDKFEIMSLLIQEAKDTKDLKVALPGVYVFWYGDKIIKVGRHLVNSRKRALEHIRDNTKNDDFEMKHFDSCHENCGLVLINCKDVNDFHWPAAIEIYMEKVLEPIIKSKRTG